MRLNVEHGCFFDPSGNQRLHVFTCAYVYHIRLKRALKEKMYHLLRFPTRQAKVAFPTAGNQVTIANINRDNGNHQVTLHIPSICSLYWYTTSEPRFVGFIRLDSVTRIRRLILGSAVTKIEREIVVAIMRKDKLG
nr:uncharacterized protein LOC124210962 [Neodiprion pinetum]